MVLTHRNRFIAAVVLAAWLYDFFFWKHTPGISVPLYIGFLITIGLVLAYGEGIRPAVHSYVIIVTILFFTAMLVTRLEPFTLAVSSLMILVLMVGLALSLRSGHWLRYRLVDWFIGFFRLLWGALSGGASLVRKPAKSENTESVPSDSQAGVKKQLGGKWRPVLTGLFLALPVVLLFGWILSMADPVFAKLLNEWIAIERWPEYIWRGIYIALLAYLAAGIYLFAMFKGQDLSSSVTGDQASKKGLGGIEAITVLVCVNLLFAAFVAVQFQYFFGGQTNINIDGFTYAEYARRGFFELVLVAGLSLLLLLGLDIITRRNSDRQRNAYSALGVLLVGLVGIILYSAFVRLQLYEIAYGFTRLRTYTHVFIVWLGILLLITAIIEVMRKSYLFTSALLLVSLGFAASLVLLNVDGFIVRQNVMRATHGYELDVYYLTQLSDDAVPVMADFHSSHLNEKTRVALGAAFVCRQFQSNKNEINWRSHHFSRAAAQRALDGLEIPWDQYEYSPDERRVTHAGGDQFTCYYSFW
jgi:hypothetical protein